MTDGSLISRLKGLTRLWRELGGAGTLDPDFSDSEIPPLVAQMQTCLDARGGEVSARARAVALGRQYLALSPVGKGRFLAVLAHRFGPDRATVDHAVTTLLSAGDDEARGAAERQLRAALEPPRLRLLTQFNALPEGVRFLVDLRADLLAMAKGESALAALEADLRGLLASWFDVGFLELTRITWRSPANILERIIASESVHAMQGWDDLKNRLDESDRRLYAFFHPRMADEPLIFVEVALTRGMAASIQALLDPLAPVGNPAEADSAIFYSINNALPGLAGISFGGFLIKRVVDELKGEFPRLKTFATLSPIPGFRAWLEGREEARVLLDAPDSESVKGPLVRLAARYLYREKRKDGRSRDPVAHFHLSNGARIERLNWQADISAKGMAQSCGMMVNYLYRLSDMEANHEAYTGRGRVAAAGDIKALAKG
jgi:malonyl-CoA decarboxylase